MVLRRPIRCHLCRNTVVIRITIEGGLQPFVFACPYCRAGVHGSLYAEPDPEKPFELRSEDFDVLETESENADDLAVAVNTSLPVPLALIGQESKEALVTPFIYLSMQLDNNRLLSLTQRVEKLRALREQAYPHCRRAASYLARGEMEPAKAALRGFPGGDAIDFREHDPISVASTATTALYEPFEDTDTRMAAADEWARTIGKASDTDREALRKLYAEFDKGPLGNHRARVIDTSFAVLREVEALFPALWAELIEISGDVDEYRVMRDDFDVLKARYQDIFELGSRTLAFTARVANVAYRRDASAHSDGKTRTLNKALNKTTSHSRERWLDEFPRSKALYASMKRHTRNDIGHRLVHYNFESGKLVYDDGREENYLLFLIDYLNAARLSHHLLDVCELLWHTRGEILGPAGCAQGAT